MTARAWEAGSGAALPNGTWAWVAVKIPDGAREGEWLKTIEWRREGGWGSNGDDDEHREGPRFRDEGQDAMLMIMGYAPLRVAYYQILDVPGDPP